MQTITANIRGKIRKETLLGRTYWVAPCTLIVPGVLDGSNGKKLYTANEMAKTEHLWNDIPLVLEHPKENGKFISARSRPDVLSQCQLGRVYNVNMTSAGLEGEAWFDYKITKAKEPQIIANLKAGTNMELSTGLQTEDVAAPANSKFNGVKYDLIATNHKPDHLAILMTKQGACSLKDGCGVHVNEQGSPINGNELSHDQLRGAFRTLLSSQFTQAEPSFYIYDVYDSYFVFEQGSKLYQMRYSKTETGVALLDETPVEVVRKVSFSPVTNQKESDMSKKALIDDLVTNGCGCWTEEDRATLEGMSEDRLTSLVANSKETKQLQIVANEAKKGITVGKATAKFDAKKGKFVVNQAPEEDEDEEGGDAEEVPTRHKTTVNSKKDKELTLNEWLKDAPAAARSAVKNAISLEKNEKRRLVSLLTANVAEDDREAKAEKLMKKDLEDLQEMVELLPTANQRQDEESSDSEPSFFGAALAVNSKRGQKSDPSDILDTPTINWSAKT